LGRKEKNTNKERLEESVCTVERELHISKKKASSVLLFREMSRSNDNNLNFKKRKGGKIGRRRSAEGVRDGYKLISIEITRSRKWGMVSSQAQRQGSTTHRWGEGGGPRDRKKDQKVWGELSHQNNIFNPTASTPCHDAEVETRKN